jgi:hypothetical protein
LVGVTITLTQITLDLTSLEEIEILMETAEMVNFDLSHRISRTLGATTTIGLGEPDGSHVDSILDRLPSQTSKIVRRTSKTPWNNFHLFEVVKETEVIAVVEETVVPVDEEEHNSTSWKKLVH